MKPGQPKYVKQFACGIMDFTSQYGGEHPRSFSYSVNNIVGEPRIYPGYGDYTQAAVLRTYGPWWNESEFSPKKFDNRPKTKAFHSEDYVDLVFEQAVYPWSIAIYETYNPGSVVRISALCQNFPKKRIRSRASEGSSEEESNNIDYDEQPIPMPFKSGCTHWELLWETNDPERNKPQVSNEARMFAPILREIKSTTRIIRLEFCSKFLDYYAELDAVELTGTLSYCHTSCVDPPLELVKKLSLSDDLPEHVASSSSDLKVVRYTDNEPKTEFIREMEDCNSQAAVTTETEPYEEIGNGFFDLLPNEIISYIFSFLPVPDLCSSARVCHLFRGFSYHPSRFAHLDLSSYWDILNDDALLSIKSRCNPENLPHTLSHNQGILQRINLSWYGGGDISSSHMLKKFIAECGTPVLTSLILSSSPAVTDSVLSAICDHCTNLRDLELPSVDKPTSEGMRVLHKLTKLRSLNVYRTQIDDAGVICILHANPDLEVLNLGSCNRIQDYDRVFQEIAQHCPQMKVIDCWRAKTLTSHGLNEVAEACDLRELDFGWCGSLQSSSRCFQNLAKNCPNLTKLFLTANRRLCDIDITSLALHCKKLQKLDILGTRLVSLGCMQNLLSECKEMSFLDVSFCASFTKDVVRKLSQDYPKLHIKRSFQVEN